MRIEYIFSGGFAEEYSEIILDDEDLMLTFSKKSDSLDADGQTEQDDLERIKELVANVEWSEMNAQYGEVTDQDFYHTIMVDLNEAQRYGITIQHQQFHLIHKDLDKLIYHLILLQGKYLDKFGGNCNPQQMPFPFSLTCKKNEEVSRRILQDFIMECRRSPTKIRELKELLKDRWKNA